MTDGSNDGIGVVLLQGDVSKESRESDAQEKDSAKCEFDHFLGGIGLQLIYFISR